MLRERDFPGLVRVYQNDGSIELIWAASPAAIAGGFTPEIVQLHYPDWSPELAKSCQDLEVQMAAWLADREKADKSIVFDGTIGALIKIYLRHPDSPFHEKQQNTRRLYHYNLQRLNRVVGRCQLNRLNGVDFDRGSHWFKEPKQEGEAKLPNAPNATNQITSEQALAIVGKAHELGHPEMALAFALMAGCALRNQE